MDVDTIDLEEFRDYLVRCCHIVGVLPGEREDIIQTTMVKALENLHTCRGLRDGQVKMWLHTILRNTFIDDVHRRRHRGPEMVELDPEIHVSHLAHHDEYPFIEEELSEETQELMRVIKEEINASMTEPLLRYVEGTPYDDIAEELDIPLGTVKSRIFNARKKINRIMDWD